MQRLDSTVHSCSEPAQDPPACERQLLGVLKIAGWDKVVAEVDHGKLDGVPQLVAPVTVGYYTLDVQVDVTSLQHSSTCRTCRHHTGALM